MTQFQPPYPPSYPPPHDQAYPPGQFNPHAPYGAPSWGPPSPPPTASHGASVLRDRPRTVAAGRGLAWIGDGFGMVAPYWKTWLGILLLMLVINIGLPLLPVIGSIVSALTPMV